MSPTSSEPIHPFATDEDFEAQIPQIMRRLEIITRRRVESAFAGAYQAIFQGQGMVFSDVRPYQPGDEVRWIDWNVSARMDDLYIKQFIEERERTVLVVWDASESMRLGQQHRSKRELAIELAMLFAMSANQNGDRVGLIIFTDKVEHFITPQRGRKHIMRMIQILLRFEPKTSHSNTQLKETLLFLQRTSPRHSIAFVLSDFIAPHEEGIWQMLKKQCECIPIWLTTPHESSLYPTVLDASSTQPSSWQKTWTGWPAALTLSFGFALWAFIQGGMAIWSAGIASLFCLGTTYALHAKKQTALCHVHDLETGESSYVDVGHTAFVEAYAQKAQQHRQTIQGNFRRLQLDLLELSTEEDYVPSLLRFFRQRQKRSH